MHQVSVDDVIHVLATLKEPRGSNTKQIIKFFRKYLSHDNQKRDLTTQIRLALKKGVHKGLLTHCAGRYKIRASIASRKYSVSNCIKVDIKPSQLNAITKNDNTFLTSESGESISCNDTDSNSSLDNEISSNKFSNETEWAVIEQQCPCPGDFEKLETVVDSDKRGEYVWTSNKNEYNGNTLQVSTGRTNYSGTIQAMPQKLASHHFMTTSITPTFYTPSSGHIVPDYLKQNLQETSNGLKKASELLEISCDQLTLSLTSPYKPATNQMVAVPCAYPISVMPPPQTSHSLIYVPTCDHAPQNTKRSSRQQVKCSRNFDETLWKLGDKKSTCNVEKCAKSNPRPTIKQKHCRMSYLGSEKGQNTDLRYYRQQFCDCHYKQVMMKRKNNTTRSSKKTRAKSKVRARKPVQPKKRQTRNHTTTANAKKSRRILPTRRAPQKRQRKVKNYTDAHYNNEPCKEKSNTSITENNGSNPATNNFENGKTDCILMVEKSDDLDDSMCLVKHKQKN